MSVLLLVRNDPNLLAFTIVSHWLVLFWRNWRINSKSYGWWGEKFMHLTDTYDVPSGIGILVTYMSIRAEKRNYWWQSENTKDLWITYANSLNMIIFKKCHRHFVLFFIKSEGFFLPFEKWKRNILKTPIQRKLKPVIFFIDICIVNVDRGSHGTQRLCFKCFIAQLLSFVSFPIEFEIFYPMFLLPSGHYWILIMGYNHLKLHQFIKGPRSLFQVPNGYCPD